MNTPSDDIIDIEPEVTKVKYGSIAHKGLLALLETMNETKTKDTIYVLPGSNIAVAVAIIGIVEERSIH